MIFIYLLLGWLGFGLLLSVTYVFWFHHGPKSMWDFFEFQSYYTAEMLKGKNNHLCNLATRQLEEIQRKRKETSDFILSTKIIFRGMCGWPLLLIMVWLDYKWNKAFRKLQ